MPLSTYGRNAVINTLLRSGPVYLGLWLGSPVAGGSEVSGKNYARRQVTFSAPSNGIAHNSNTVTYPQASGSWGTVNHVGIYDALVDGNLIAWAALAGNHLIDVAHANFEFAPGAVEITFF